MSAAESAKQLFDSIPGIKDAVQAIAPGLKDLVPEFVAEMKRQMTQTRSELGHALYAGSAYLPYGDGQKVQQQQQQGQQLERSISI